MLCSVLSLLDDMVWADLTWKRLDNSSVLSAIEEERNESLERVGLSSDPKLLSPHPNPTITPLRLRSLYYGALLP